MPNPQRILVAQMARVWLAPVGTAAPTDAVAAMAAAWKDVGLFSPDSLAFNTNPTFESVRSHQSNYETRAWQTEDAATAEVDLQEWSADNFKAVYGGGTVTKTGTSPNWIYKFSPPAIGARTEVACVIEIIDGAKNYRRIIPRSSQREGVSQALNKTSNAALSLRLTVLGGDIGDAWYDLSNDPAFDPGP